MGFERYHRSILPDEIIVAFYQRLIDCGRERMSYPSTPPRSAEEYLQMVRESGPWWLITFDGELAGCFYLTDLEGAFGRCHFAFLPSPPGLRVVGGAPFPVTMCRYITSAVLHDQYPGGAYIVDTLMGATPTWNKGTMKLMDKCGGVSLGVVPGLYYSHEERANTDGKMAYFTRGSVPLDWAVKGEGCHGEG